jgi:hypothetical protein
MLIVEKTRIIAGIRGVNTGTYATYDIRILQENLHHLAVLCGEKKDLIPSVGCTKT